MTDTSPVTRHDGGGSLVDAIAISDNDNVATCLHDIDAGAQVVIKLGKDTRILAATDPIPRGHKLALQDIAEGEDVRKYGEVIGKASRPIAKGNHVHTQNVVD